MKLTKKGNILILFGVALLIAALALSVYNMHESNQAFQSVNRVTDELIPMIEETISLPQENAFPDYREHPDMEMPTLEIDGNRYLGYLEIPDLELVLPIAAGEWSYEKLKSTPCIYTGSIYQNNMVIAAHNYNSHFGRLKNLAQGAPIRFTDATGNVFSYTVAWSEVIEPSDREGMVASDGWDLTLFSCTYRGKHRFTLRCVLDESTQ